MDGEFFQLYLLLKQEASLHLSWVMQIFNMEPILAVVLQELILRSPPNINEQTLAF